MEIALFQQKIDDFEIRLPNAQTLESAEELRQEIEDLRPALETLSEDHPLRFCWVKSLVAILIRLGSIYYEDLKNQTKAFQYYRQAQQEDVQWRQELGENSQIDFQTFHWKTSVNIAVSYSVMGELGEAEAILWSLNDEIEKAIAHAQGQPDKVIREIYDVEGIVKNEILFEISLAYFDEDQGIEAREPMILEMINKLTTAAENKIEGSYILSPKLRAQIWLNCAEAFNRMGQRSNKGEFEQAISYLEKLEALADSIDINLLTHSQIQKAEIYQIQGAIESAIPIFVSTLENQQVDSFRRCYAGYCLGQTYQKQGDKDAAKKVYQYAMKIYRLDRDGVPNELVNDMKKALDSLK